MRDDRPGYPHRLRRRQSAAQHAVTLATAGFALAWFFPIFWTFYSLLGNGWTLEPYIDALIRTDLPRWYLNSLVTSIATTIGVVGIGALTGYALSQIVFPGRKWLYGLVIASFIVPVQALIVNHFVLMHQLNLLNAWGGIILPQLVAPLAIIVYKQFFDALPKALREAALMDNASHWTRFLRLYLPISSSVTAGLAIITFIGSWNTFLWPFLAVTYERNMTVTVALDQVSSNGLAATILAALPVMVVYGVLHKRISSAIMLSGGVKG